MTANRKAKTKKTSTTLPEEHIEIPKVEQWRLINDTGILKQPIPSPRPTLASEDQEDTQLGAQIFNSIILIIPFSFLLLMMEILIHTQYGRQPTLKALADRMIPSVPIISIFIFYTTRYKQHRVMQIFLFLLSVIVGPRMIYLINRGSWLVNMRQCPPLATIWVYTIVQLDLSPAILNLVVVGIWVWWTGMKLIY